MIRTPLRLRPDSPAYADYQKTAKNGGSGDRRQNTNLTESLMPMPVASD